MGSVMSSNATLAPGVGKRLGVVETLAFGGAGDEYVEAFEAPKLCGHGQTPLTGTPPIGVIDDSS